MEHTRRSPVEKDEAVTSSVNEELWMVQAVIQPFKLDHVTRALEALSGFSGMTVSRVRGFGREKLEDRHDANVRLAQGGKRVHEPLDDSWSGARLRANRRGT